jgi:hypothetical protein
VRRTGARIGVAVVVVVALLVGNQLWQRHQARLPVTDPARPGVPAVHWPNGHGTGRWDRDPWVETLREAMTLVAAAINSADFTDPALRNIVSEDYLEAHVRHTTTLDSSYLPGPWPFAVLDVESSETSATVRACERGHWLINTPDYVPTPDMVTTGPSHRVAWELAMRADGSRYVESFSRVERPYHRCPAEGIVVGYFDPPPPYRQPRGPVIGPDGQVRERFNPYGAPLTVEPGSAEG